MSTPRDFARNFYPFLDGPSGGKRQTDPALLVAVRNSTMAKCAEVVALRSEMLLEYEEQLERAAGAMAARFITGGKLMAFGNGGSATDADDAATDCMSPPIAGWRSLPAVSLPAESATVTAIANDVGLDSVFVRQLGAVGARDDIALGISTSGNSGNVVAAFAEARRRGMLTVALAGHDGGALTRAGVVDFCFVARRAFVPRIQEGHATLWHALLGMVQHALGSGAGHAA